MLAGGGGIFVKTKKNKIKGVSAEKKKRDSRGKRGIFLPKKREFFKSREFFSKSVWGCFFARMGIFPKKIKFCGKSWDFFFAKRGRSFLKREIFI